jgi:hypothetical protein
MAIDLDATFETEDDTANAFLKLLDAETPSESDEKRKPASEETPEEDEEDEAPNDDEAEGETEDAEEEPSEDDEGNEDETEEKPAQKKYADDDDTYVKVKVNDEEHEVPVKDLKRLWGQEASLTKKSQEVAAQSKKADEAQARSVAALDVLVKRAAEAANPYRQINWAGLMKDPNVSADEVAALQEAAKAAFDNETFLTGQLDNFMQAVVAQQRDAAAKQAADCIKALTDDKSPTYIKGWNQTLYNDIRQFAVTQGVSKDLVNALNDPGAFKILHMAMQFNAGSKKVVTTKPVNKSPKKIVKSSTASTTPTKGTTKAVARKEALAKQKRAGGNMESTANAFAALFGDD